MQILFFFLIFLIHHFELNACTTFFAGDSSDGVMAKSFDWHQTHGFAVVNPRNLSKLSLTLKTEDKQASWNSKYGSLTFNQHGRDFPLSGINEAGLKIEVLWLNGTIYPKPSEKPTLNELQWVQYQLDTKSSVEEVISDLDNIRISKAVAKVHYFVCDTHSNCASIEWFHGKPVVHTGETLPISVLANHSYVDSMNHLKRFVGFGGSLPIPSKLDSLSRFVRAASFAHGADRSKLVSNVFSTLRSVAQRSTQWNLVYEKNDHVHFRTKSHPSIKTIHANFDYNCLKPAIMLDMNQNFKDDLSTHWVPLTTERNLQMVTLGLNFYKKLLPPGSIKTISEYPNSFRCEHLR